MGSTALQGVMLPRDLDPRRVIDFVVRAEQLGFDELWVVEDLGFRGGIAQAAIALAVTERLRVGIGILPAAIRNVAFAAMEVGALAQVYPGRLDVGVGHGMPDWLRSVGAWPRRPLGYLEAYVTALHGLLRGETVRAEGEVVLEDVTLDPSAVPEVVPDIILGVRGPRSLAVSGRIAAGTVLAEPSTPEYVRAARGAIAAPGPHRVITYNVAAVSDDSREALAIARGGLEWIGDEGWRPHIEPLDFAEEFFAHRARSADRAAFAAGLPDDWVRRLALAGTPDEVRSRVRALAAAGVTSSVMIPVGDDPLAALESLARAL